MPRSVPVNTENITCISLGQELIDAALLRPGRLEVQVEVPRPDASGRQQILEIQTSQLRAKGCLSPRTAASLSSGALSRVTYGFSGADIAGLMRSATSYALERYVDEALLNGWEPGAAKKADAAAGSGGAGGDAEERLLEVCYEDIVRALREASPRAAYSRKPAAGANRQPGGEQEARLRLRGWWRERRLKALTDRALA